MDWKTELTDAVNQTIKAKNIDKTKIPFSKINFRWVLGITTFVTILLLILITVIGLVKFFKSPSSIDTSSISTIIKTVFIPDIVIIIVSAILHIVIIVLLKRQGTVKQNVKNSINTNINLISYYDKAIKTEVNPKLTAVNITPSFQNWPVFLHNYAFHEMITNDVLNMSHPNYELSIGAITERYEEEHTDSDGDSNTEYIYYRRLILTGRYNKSFEVSAYIHPTNILNKLYKGSNNVSLESPQFNKLFNVTSNDQINIRKMLTPKVMVNLMDLAQNEQKTNCPFISIENNEIAMILSPFKVFSYYDPSYLVGKINISNNISETPEKYVETIERDINLMHMFIKWLNALDISSN